MKNFISELGQFLQQLKNEQRPLSTSQIREIHKAEKIAIARDNVQPTKDKSLWQDF